jgi:hypothetical protein
MFFLKSTFFILQLLDHDGAGPAAAVADGRDSSLTFLESVGQVQGDPAAGRPEGVAERDRATVDVNFTDILKNQFRFT